MKTVQKNIICICFIFIAQGYCFAQDIHFSQFFNNPIALNPALAGFHQNTARFAMSYRDQWRFVTVPFQTFSISGDFVLFRKKFGKSMMGFGFDAKADQAGDSRFGTTQANGCLSWLWALDNKGDNVISAGLLAGYAQRTIDYTKLIFDNQFNGDYFNPSLPTGEILPVERFTFPDFSAGLHYQCVVNTETSYSFGLSAWHLNRPNQSILNDNAIQLPIRYQAYSEMSYNIKTSLILKPAILFARQGNASEILIGTRFKSIKSFNPTTYSAIMSGVFTRFGDALTLLVGYEGRTYSWSISYDINYSKLRKASYLQGGPELNFIYLMNKSKTQKIKAIPCPSFY